MGTTDRLHEPGVRGRSLHGTVLTRLDAVHGQRRAELHQCGPVGTCRAMHGDWRELPGRRVSVPEWADGLRQCVREHSNGHSELRRMWHVLRVLRHRWGDLSERTLRLQRAVLHRLLLSRIVIGRLR